VDSAGVTGGWQTIGEDGDTYSLFALADIRNGSAAGSLWYTNATVIELRQEDSGINVDVAFNFGVASNVLALGRNVSGGGGEIVSGITTVNDGFHFVSVSVNDDTVRFFVDGTFRSTATFVAQTGDCSVGTYNPCDLTIGCRTTGVGAVANTVDGYISAIGVVNTNLTDTEISRLYGELMQ
jgi:hypothetical protein